MTTIDQLGHNNTFNDDPVLVDVPRKPAEHPGICSVNTDEQDQTDSFLVTMRDWLLVIVMFIPCLCSSTTDDHLDQYFCR